MPGERRGSSAPASTLRLRGPGPGDLAEHAAGGEPGAARIVEIKDAADQLSRRIETGDRREITVDDLPAIRIDAQPAEGEAHAAADLIGLEGRLRDGVGPVRFVD